MARHAEIEGLTAEMPFAAAAALIVETRAGELLERTEGALDTDDIEPLHRARVATRRLRAALEVFAPCFPPGDYKPLLKEVKAIADALGERRDADVAIAALRGFSDSIARPDRPGIESLIGDYRTEQAAANDELAPQVTGERMARLRDAALQLAAEARKAAAGSPDAGVAR